MMYPPQQAAGAVPYSPQMPFPSQQAAGAVPYSPQMPFPSQQAAEAVPYPSQTPFPPQQAAEEAVSYSPQMPFPSQQAAEAVPYPPQMPFPSQQVAGAVLYPPQTPFPSQQPLGMMSYSPQDPFSQQNSYILSQPYEEPRNLQAKRAILNGTISFVLSVFTLSTSAGFAGLITGTLAIVYGFMGLRATKQLPNNIGRRQAIIGIALGSLAWFVILLSLIIRTANPST